MIESFFEVFVPWYHVTVENRPISYLDKKKEKKKELHSHECQ